MLLPIPYVANTALRRVCLGTSSLVMRPCPSFTSVPPAPPAIPVVSRPLPERCFASHRLCPAAPPRAPPSRPHTFPNASRPPLPSSRPKSMLPRATSGTISSSSFNCSSSRCPPPLGPAHCPVMGVGCTTSSAPSAAAASGKPTLMSSCASHLHTWGKGPGVCARVWR